MAAFLIKENGKERRVTCQPGVTLSQALGLYGISLSMPCAGRGTCGKCRLKAKGELSPYSEEELRLLTREERERGIRLACRAKILGDVWVELEHPTDAGRVISKGLERIFEKKPSSTGWGAAVDVGTTTMAAYLYRLSDCVLMARAGGVNPQAPWGADVIARMERSLSGEGEALALAIASEIDQLFAKMAGQAGVETGEIREVVVTANTAMLYLLTGTHPGELTHAPFAADRRFGEWTSGERLRLASVPQARVYLPRCASAFVGADITTAVLASGMTEQKEPSLLLDIGTNGEMALWSDGRMICCSTAAGPALEGGNIRMGMSAVPGAIDSVVLQDGEIRYATIGGTEAKGLCGSGLIDGVAALLRAGVLEDTGAIAQEGHGFGHCLCEVDGQPAFRFPGSTVVLTQQDIRNVQLAKGAVCAGMLTLLSHAGRKPENLSTLYLAGGFGSLIRIDSAAEIGLIPQVLAKRTRVIGNAAGMGACMLLQNGDYREETEELAEHMETTVLSQNPLFTQYYMDCMMLEPVL